MTKKFSARPLRVGIIGAGLMGAWHARAAERAGAVITGVADVNEKLSEKLASAYSSAQAFSDLPTLLSQKSLDVLHICTPTSTHHEIAQIAIESKINLLIEKPLAQAASQTIMLCDLAAKHDVSICPTHQFSFQKGVIKAKKLLPRIGEIIHLQATICSAGSEGLGAGQADIIAADILPHPLSVSQTILSDCLPLENWSILRPLAGELRIFGQAQQTSLSYFISMNARPTVNLFEIVGTAGTIHLNLFHGTAFITTGTTSRKYKIFHPFDSAARQFSVSAYNLVRRTFQREFAYPGLQQLIKDFYRSISDNSKPPIMPQQIKNIALIRDHLLEISTSY